MHIETFTSDQVPQSARARQFQREMERRFSLGLVLEPTCNEPLRTRVTAYSSARLRFAELELSPHRAHCTQSRCDSPGRLLISIHHKGSGMVSQSGRSQQIDAGHMFVLDPSRPFCTETSALRARSVYLPTDSVRAVLPQLDEVTARRIDVRNGTGRIFATLIDQMFATAHELDEHATDSLADALPHMLVAALEGTDAAPLECNSRLTLLHRHRIQQFAREHLRDPQLDAKMIAEGVSLSIRRVYELFYPSSASLMKWVWQERLERCRRDLSTAALRARPIGAIAFAWGFSDICHFSRSFKQRYGMTPREWRTSKTHSCD